MKIKKYLKSFWKYYLLRNPKLLLTLILTLIIYIWISIILKEILPDFTSRRGLNFREIGYAGTGLYLLFIKPIFVYIAGLIIIKKI